MIGVVPQRSLALMADLRLDARDGGAGQRAHADEAFRSGSRRRAPRVR